MKYAYGAEEVIAEMMHVCKPSLELATCFIDLVDAISSVDGIKPECLLREAFFVLDEFSSNEDVCFRCLKASFSKLNSVESKQSEAFNIKTCVIV